MLPPPQPSPPPQQRKRAVAVSGGPDSMALLHRLARRDRAELVALTVDHGLRPEAAAEAAKVGAWCWDAGIEHRTLRLNLDPGRGNVQARARIARYRALLDFCLLNRIFVLSLAHHADDQLETFALRQAKDSGGLGLAGMASKATVRCVTIDRPLLGESKAALGAYCGRHRLPVSHDPSNADPKFDRVRVRADIGDWTEEKKRDCLARLAVYGRARQTHEAALAAQWPQILNADGEAATGALALERGALLAAASPGWYLGRALSHVRPQTTPFSQEALARLLVRIGETTTGVIGTLGGVMLIVRRTTLWLVREPAQIFAPIQSGQFQSGQLLAGKSSPESGLAIWDQRFVLRPEAGQDPGHALRATGSQPRDRLRTVAPALLTPPYDAFPAVWRQGLPAWFVGDQVRILPALHVFSPDSEAYSCGATFCPGRPLAEIFNPQTNYSPDAVV